MTDAYTERIPRGTERDLTSHLHDLQQIASDLALHFGMNPQEITDIRRQLRDVQLMPFTKRGKPLSSLQELLLSRTAPGVFLDSKVSLFGGKPVIVVSYQESEKDPPGFLNIGDDRDRKLDIFPDHLTIHTSIADIQIGYDAEESVNDLYIQTLDPPSLGLITPTTHIAVDAPDITRGNIRLLRGDNTSQFPLSTKPLGSEHINGKTLANEVNYGTDGSVFNIRTYFKDTDKMYVVVYSIDAQTQQFVPTTVSCATKPFHYEKISIPELRERESYGLQLPRFTLAAHQFAIQRQTANYLYPRRIKIPPIIQSVRLYIQKEFGPIMIL